MSRNLTLFALFLSTTAFAGQSQDAFFVRVDRSVPSAAAEGSWTGADVSVSSSGPASLELDLDATGALVATVHGDLADGGTIQGWSVDGASALIGIEPDEIDFMGQPFGGIEPDEIDFMGSCEPLAGIEPDEIDVAIAVTELGEVLELRSDLGAYLVVEVVPQRDGSTVLNPTHVLTNANCF